MGLWDLLGMREQYDPNISSRRCSCGRYHHKPQSLPSLIALTWHFAATDPRDVIFALLGLAEESSEPHQVSADYSRSESDVHIEAARLFIEAQGDNDVNHVSELKAEPLDRLEGLSFVQHPASPADLRAIQEETPSRPRLTEDTPTWVPYFHQQLEYARIYSTRFLASGLIPAQILPSTSRLLRLHGCQIDTITQLE